MRDAVVEGGTRMGMGGSVGFVGRVFGGMAARNGATLTAESVASVAAKSEAVSGTIAGDIADRSLGNYMPQTAGHKLKIRRSPAGTSVPQPLGRMESPAMSKCTVLPSLKSLQFLIPW